MPCCSSFLNYETTWIEIAIETAVGGGELQDAVVGVCHAAWVVLRISIPPNHLFALGVSQHLHRASQQHTFEAFGIAEIDAGLRIGLLTRKIIKILCKEDLLQVV